MRLVVGPWIGEFGWEVMCWQGYARARAQYFDHVVCISRTGHDYLYEDFCDEYVRHDPVTSDASAAHAKGDEDSRVHLRYLEAGTEWMAPSAYQCGGFPTWAKPMYVDGRQINQTFRKFGKRKPQLAYDLIVHSRNREIRRWSRSSLADVVRYYLTAGFRIACVGSLNGSFPIVGCDDLRGLPLRELSNVFASSSAILGSSSGPLHFASLCGCPQIVISDRGNRYRYETAWNPFQSRVMLIEDHGWDPPSERVIAKCNAFLNLLQTNSGCPERSAVKTGP